MRFGLFLLTACTAVITFNGYSQTVTLSGKNLQLKKVFSSIKSQTGYVFFYDAKLLNEAKPVTIDLKNVSLEEALQQIFSGQPFDWAIESKTIAIIKKPGQPAEGVQQPERDNRPDDQPIKITGTVTDQDNRPIEAASVMVKGTLTGTAANENGAFSIEAHKGNTLVVSSAGYTQKQVVVEGNTIALRLELEFTPLEKLIVGSNITAIRRKAEVSSVAVIDSKTLENLPYQNIEQIYRGVVSGTNNIQPGYETAQYNYGSGSVSIRGASDFSGGYGVIKIYVDGIEFAGNSYFLNSLDKNNIDRIEVVKGPSASTLYGSGASGGVILVYTKRPPINTTKINLSTSVGWYDSKWQDKKPFRQIHSFNISQGFENVSYFIAGDINNNETYMPDGRQNRYSLSGNVTYAKNNLKVTVEGQHYNNSYSPERNAFWDTSSNAYFKTAGFQLPDTGRGVVKTNLISANVTYKVSKWWTHNLIVGWSDNFLSKISFLTNSPYVLSESKWKGPSLRYYNTIIFKGRSHFRASLLTGVEYSNILDNFLTTRKAGSRIIIIKIDTADLQKNTGVFAQVNPSYKDKIFLTISGRYEINKTFGTSFNPRIGATTNFDIGKLTLKPRISWGRGITPPSWGTRYPPPNYIPTSDLKPQQQSGWDYGVEGYFPDGNLTFEICRYDYILKDGIYTSVEVSPLGTPLPKYVNAGELSNNGWEFSASYHLKNLSVSANYSIMNSILKEPLSGKPSANDLVVPGEQMQFIPKNTGGITLGYVFTRLFGHSDQLSVSANLTYTSGASTIDFVAYTYDLGVFRNPSNLINYGLRYYKTQLSASAKVNVNLEYNVLKDLRVFMQLSNLTNNTSPEYNNTFPSIGRGWMFGLKYNFSRTTP